MPLASCSSVTVLRVRLKRDGIRRLIVPQLDFRLDFDRRSKSEWRISFDFDTLERRNFDEDRRDTGLSERHGRKNPEPELRIDILLHRFGIALL